MPIHSPSGMRCTCTTRSVFMNVHFPGSSLRADAVGVVGDREQSLQLRHGLTLDEIDRRLEPRLPGPAVPTMGQPSPVQAVDVVAVPPVRQPPAVSLGQRPQRRGRRVDDFRGVDGLQPPSAGLRDRSRFAVGSERQHLGADQLDLLAGALDTRAHPQVALGGNASEQVDKNPAQPGVVALFAALQRAHQQCRHRCAVLNRGRPRAAHQIGG